MTVGKASAFAMALVAALAVGVWIGPSITATADRDEVTAAETSSATARDAAPAPRAAADREDRDAMASIPASAPALQARVKPLLNMGTDMNLASAGFGDDAEMFAAVAHAARNTEIPFVVLKHRVLVKKMSLEDAIAELKPDRNADIEADLAKAAARADLAAVVSG
jgi:hypothetical protein